MPVNMSIKDYVIGKPPVMPPQSPQLLGKRKLAIAVQIPLGPDDIERAVKIAVQLKIFSPSEAIDYLDELIDMANKIKSELSKTE